MKLRQSIFLSVLINVMERAKHSFLLCPILLSCPVMNKIMFKPINVDLQKLTYMLISGSLFCLVIFGAQVPLRQKY